MGYTVRKRSTDVQRQRNCNSESVARSWIGGYCRKCFCHSCKRKLTMHEKEDSTRKKKESIVDLSRFIDKKVRVKFQGGREASGILKGYDPLINLVLDNAVEYVRDSEDPQKLTEETRQLGLIVARGTAITVVAPNDGIEQIGNPFI